MFSSRRSCLYAFVLSLSSAIITLGLPYSTRANEKNQRPKETGSEQIGRKFKTDFNLMQNLMIQLEQVSDVAKPQAINNKQNIAKDRALEAKPSSDTDVSNADKKWVEDEIGMKSAGVKKLKAKPHFSKENLLKVKQPPLRIRSR